MKRFALFIAGLILSLNCFASDVPLNHQKAISGVINTMLTSLQKGDSEVAFSMNVSEIREKFGSPGRFAEVIREHYPPLLTHTSAMVVEINVMNGETLALVMLDDGGAVYAAVFTMEINENGIWQIAACQLFLTPAKGI